MTRRNFVVFPLLLILLGAPGHAAGHRLREKIHLQVCPRSNEEALRELGLCDKEAEKMEVYYFDTEQDTLYHHGLILRARHFFDKSNLTTVKIKDLRPSDLGGEWQAMPDLSCKEDSFIDSGFVDCSFVGEVSDATLADVLAGQKGTEELFTKMQRRFIARFAESKPEWESLLPHGPVDVREWKLKTASFDSKFHIQFWQSGTGDELLETSLKVDESDEGAAEKLLRRFLRKHDLAACEKSQSKVEFALKSLF